MNYCGIDLAGVSSYAYVTDEKGRKLWAGPVETEKAAFERLVKKFRRGGLAIAIEAGNQTAWVYEELVKLGAEVTVVNPTKVKLIAESRRKNGQDRRQDLVRVAAARRPAASGAHARAGGTRAAWAAGGSSAIGVGPLEAVQRGARACCVRRACDCRRELSTPTGWKRLFAAGFEHDHLMHIVTAYHDSFLALTNSIHELDKQLADREKNEPRTAQLKTMPKVGRIASLTFLAAVDDVHRFPTSRKLVGYSGFRPTVRQSGERTEYGSISREGRSELRCVGADRPHGGHGQEESDATAATWFNRVAKKRGKKTALVALARRLLVIAYQLLKSERDYDVGRLKKKRRAASRALKEGPESPGPSPKPPPPSHFPVAGEADGETTHGDTT